MFLVPCSVFTTPYLAGIEEQLNENNPEENRFFYHPDHLGSSSFITDADGEGYQHLQYLPFGETAVSQKLSWWSTPYQFTGKEKDDETGYNYFGARYYNSEISVWLSVDPIIKPFESPYVYCFNNPVRFIDPTGMDSDPIEKFNRKKEKYESKGGHWRGRNLTRYINKHQDELNMYQAKFDKERREVTYIKGNNLGGSSKKIGNTKSGDPMLLGSKYIHELVTIKGKQDFGAHVISFVNLFAAAGPAGIYFDWGIIIDSYSDVQFYTTIGWAFGAGVCVGFGYSYIDKEISCEEFAEGEVDGFQGTVLSTPISLEIYGDYTNGAQNEYLFDNYRGRGGNVGFGSSYGGYRGKTVVSPVPAADFWCRPGRHF